MADNDAAFQQSVLQALQALQQAVLASMAQARPLPTPANVTEIVIRTGPSDAVAAMGTGASAGSPPPPSGAAATAGTAAAPSARAACICIGAYIESLEQLPYTENELQWIDSLIPPGNERKDVLHVLLARLIGERAPDGLQSKAPQFPPPERTSSSSGTVTAPSGEAGSTGSPPPPTEGAAPGPTPEAPPAGAQRSPRRSRRQ
jgi:hypothetical protein